MPCTIAPREIATTHTHVHVQSRRVAQREAAGEAGQEHEGGEAQVEAEREGAGEAAGEVEGLRQGAGAEDDGGGAEVHCGRVSGEPRPARREVEDDEHGEDGPRGDPLDADEGSTGDQNPSIERRDEEHGRRAEDRRENAGAARRERARRVSPPVSTSA